MAHSVERKPRHWAVSAVRTLILGTFLAFIIAALVWSAWVYVQIERYADDDEAVPADVICVFGAAEYDGRPSPILRARLDHALVLYRQGIAPLVVTLGGGDGDQHTE